MICDVSTYGWAASVWPTLAHPLQPKVGQWATHPRGWPAYQGPSR